MSHATAAPTITTSERRRVVAATTIGTAIEWYDYFLYAAVAGSYLTSSCSARWRVVSPPSSPS